MDVEEQPDWFEAPQEHQPALFDLEEPWEKHWRGMPEFIQQDLEPWKQLIISFATPGDMLEFSRLVGQKLTPKTQSIWFPEAEIGRYKNKRYGDAA